MAQQDDRQFDPVANAALGALRSTNRTVREMQKQGDLPELPAQSQGYRGARDVVKTASAFSPFNILGRGGLPEGSDLSNPLQSLPGPDQFMQSLPGMSGRGAQQIMVDSPLPTPNQGGSSNGGNGSNGGSNNSSNTSSTQRSRGGSRRQRGGGRRTRR